MKYLEHIINEDKESFIDAITRSIFEKISPLMKIKKESIIDDIFMDTILKEDVDDYISHLESEGIEYVIDGDIIIERK